MNGITALDDFAPIHVRIAERRVDVEQCLDVFGQRPVAWLCGNQRVDARWCLVHATQAEPRELRLVAERGAVVALCPSTEADRGDGVFLLPEFAAQGGRFAIGSGDHVTIDAAAELRMLEYALRLTRQQRVIARSPDHPTRRHAGRFLFDRVVDAGARALGQPIGGLGPGRRADVVVLDPSHPRLLGHGPDTVLDAFVFSHSVDSPIRDVFVAGRRVVVDGRHVARDEIVARYRRAIARLMR